jgi:hypothetical protein
MSNRQQHEWLNEVHKASSKRAIQQTERHRQYEQRTAMEYIIMLQTYNAKTLEISGIVREESGVQKRRHKSCRDKYCISS